MKLRLDFVGGQVHLPVRLGCSVMHIGPAIQTRVKAGAHIIQHAPVTDTH